MDKGKPDWVYPEYSVNRALYICIRTRSSTIYTFSLDGKYISTLDRNGRGSGEYSYIKSFSVDKQGLLHVLTHNRLLTYNNENNFLYETKTPDIENSIIDFVTIGFKMAFFYKGYSNSMNGEGDQLLFVEDNEVKDKFGKVNMKEMRMKRFLNTMTISILLLP